MTMRQRLAHIALGGVLVLSGMIASSFLQTADSQQSHTEIVKAREFHVVDENGATTAVIASDPHGLKIQSAAGKPLASVIDASKPIPHRIGAVPGGNFLGGGGGSLYIHNTAGKRAVEIHAGHGGAGALRINNTAGKPGAEITASTDGVLRVYSVRGKNAASIQGGVGDGGSISVDSATGSTFIIGGSVGVYGKNGSGKPTAVKRPRASMYVDESGNGSIIMRDKKGNPKK